MADLRQFAGRIRVMGKRLEENADALTRKTALAVDGAVVIATPVDEGRARSNWQVNLDGPAQGTIPAYEPGQEGSTGGANSRAAVEQGKSVIGQYKGGTGSAIHITNNLPYIKRLNDGWSGQAPAGFVEKAVLVGVAAVQGAGSLLQKALEEEL